MRKRIGIWMFLLVFVLYTCIPLSAIAQELSVSNETKTVKVEDLYKNRSTYEGKTISINSLSYGERSDKDSKAEILSRSDCYLHDATGSVLLHLGWQIYKEWKQGETYSGKGLEINKDGIWNIISAQVKYNEKGLPYLELQDIKQPNSSNTNWASGQIQEWGDLGLLRGYKDGSFKADADMTRAEMMNAVNSAFGFTKLAYKSFKDVKTSDWFAADVSKAVAQGYITGYGDGSVVRPGNTISRQEMAVILCKLMKIKPVDNAVLKFADAARIPDWSKGYIAAVVNAGYMNGYTDNTFQAAKLINKAEVIVTLSRVVGKPFAREGVYGKEGSTETVTGNVTVSKSGVTLKNHVINGDLILTEGIGNGHVTLDNVVVKGKTVVSGGGENSVIILNSTLGQVIINVPDNHKVRLVAEGTTSVGTVDALTTSKLEEKGLTGKGFGEVVIQIPEGAQVELQGDFDKVNVDVPAAKVEVLSGKIGELAVTQKAKSAEIKLGATATVTNLVCDAAVNVGGTGKIESAKINAGGVNIEQKPASVSIAQGVTANVNNKPMDINTPLNPPTTTATTSGGTSSGGGGGGGGGGGNNSGGPSGGSNPSTPPTLTADTSDNSVKHDIEITFTDNSAWRSSITAVRIGGTALTINTDYSVSAGKITLKPSSGNILLTTPGLKTVAVEATGYYSSTVQQNIKAAITIMYYGDMDNDLEPAMLQDIAEMKAGYVNGSGINLIALVDRIGGYSTDSGILGAEFTDTRLFQITRNTATRIGGMDLNGDSIADITTTSNFEANMGAANTLKQFIRFCKANYPGESYVLIISDHGGGAKSAGISGYSKKTGKSSSSDSREISQDVTNSGDLIYTAEITDVLSGEESVDLLGYDACLMGSLEVAYQYRPGNGSFEADYMVASAPNVWGPGWKYDEILKRLDIAKAGQENTTDTDKTKGGFEEYYSPITMTMEDLGAIIVEEQRDSTSVRADQSMSFYDLSKVGSIKTAVDEFTEAIVVDDVYQDEFEIARDATIYYSDTDYYDAYYLFSNIAAANVVDTVYTDNVMNAVDDMVLYSFANDFYKNPNDYADDWGVDPSTGFEAGKSGLSIFAFWNGNLATHPWSVYTWYNAIDTQNEPTINEPYGKLKWCIDNAVENNNTVDNWFELLDHWYDTDNAAGGDNAYHW